MDGFLMAVQFLIVLACLLVGAHKGGMSLGLMGGVGLVILVFGFRLVPGEPPIQVMLTILAVIGCAATLQTSGGLDVMMRFAEKLLRKHPQQITILGPLVTWFLTVLCGTGHVVYTMLPIIADISLKKNIRPERPMAISSVSAQMGITASPVSVAVVSLSSILAENAGTIDRSFSIPQILAVSIPASLCGVLLGALWSLRRGKDLDKDEAFQKRIADPVQREYIYGGDTTLLDTKSSKDAYRATAIFFIAIAVVVVLGAFESLRPAFDDGDGGTAPLSMNLTIQIIMLFAGALILLFCKVNAKDVPESGVFKAGMIAIFCVFGVAWMSETFFGAHLEEIESWLGSVVQSAPWAYALALFIVSKLLNSQAAAVVAMVPVALGLGVDPVTVIGFFGASYGYFLLPTYPSDLAAIGFDRSGTTHIGKYVINHSFIIPGLICVFTSCVVGFTWAHILY
ncbi:anaerobic C4-dicarboxylate transporter [Ancrocorticia populi]|uniref:anaerobic C4-dicarboxylate transporter n=1 Tax=Ancrocorticia populi TaxID=2175228 RepID=UPI002354529E|nr:anaerobic C4-dicarboxylate transporter [Ancrocorticia populi]